MNQPLDLTSLRILVIDDETFMRRLILRILSELGVKNTFEAENGAKGMKQIVNLGGKLDLIVCDIDMPVMNGLSFIEFLREGRAGQGSADLPVVILTGHSDAENIDKAISLGIQGFLVKPVSSTALEKRIRSSVGAPVINPNILNSKA